MEIEKEKERGCDRLAAGKTGQRRKVFASVLVRRPDLVVVVSLDSILPSEARGLEGSGMAKVQKEP